APALVDRPGHARLHRRRLHWHDRLAAPLLLLDSAHPAVAGGGGAALHRRRVHYPPAHGTPPRGRANSDAVRPALADRLRRRLRRRLRQLDRRLPVAVADADRLSVGPINALVEQAP